MDKKATDGDLILNIAHGAVKSKNFERVVLEVLIENKLITEEEFEMKLKKIYGENYESDFSDLLKPGEDNE